MSVVFINDHPFQVDTQGGKVYTTGTLTADVWSRFIDNFGELTVIGRGKLQVGEAQNYVQSSRDGVTFDLFYEIQGGMDYIRYRKAIIAKLTPHILNTEFIVLRLPSSIGVIAAQLCLKYGKKYIVEVVGCPFDSLWYYGGILTKLIAPINAFRNKKAIYGASNAVYVTSKYLQKRYPNPNTQINASNVVVEKFDESVLFKHLEFLQNRRDKKKIGMIGSVALPYKGYEVLFKALKGISESIELHIVGGGDPKWIESLISKYELDNVVILHGRINSRSGIYDFLDNLDLYVQPSLTEGLPRSVIEAMARACPIIASDAGGIPELIPEDKVYPATNFKMLAKLIDETLQDTAAMQRMSKENFKNSHEYTFNVINERRYHFFNQIKASIKN